MAFDEALDWAQKRLEELADLFDIPLEGRTGQSAVVTGMVLHARDLFKAVLRECDHGDIPAALVIVRSLVEATILVRWIEISPVLHVEMWLAEDDRNRLAAARSWVEMRRRRGWPAAPPLFTEQEARDIRVDGSRLRARAIEQGEPLRRDGTLLPQVEQMAQATSDTAVWEAYEILYRIASPFTHLGGRALAGHKFQHRPDGTHVVPGTFWTARGVRTIAVPAMSVLLGSGSRICGLGLEGECRIIQDTLALWTDEALGDSTGEQ